MTTPTPVPSLGLPANAPLQDPTTAAVLSGLFSRLSEWTLRVATLINNFMSGQIPGTSTNDNASTGNIGEVVTALVSSASPVAAAATNVDFNLASITLTPGDWDVRGVFALICTGVGTISYLRAGLSPTSATQPDLSVQVVTGNNGGANFDLSTTVSDRRFTLAATSTIYLVGRCGYSAGSVAACGYIQARRVR